MRPALARLAKLVKAVGPGLCHMIVCYDKAQAAEARHFLGDRFGELLFVITGVPDKSRYNEAERHEKWLRQAKENHCHLPRR